MKKTLLLLLLLFGCNILFAQRATNYIFYYDFNYQTDSTDLKSKKHEEMVLFKNDTVSVFQSYILYKRDSLIYEDIKQTFDKLSLVKNFNKYPKPKISYKIEKIIEKDSYRITDKIFSDLYQYDEKININWEIINDSIKNINQFKCKKALTTFGGRDYEAWYCEDIPISEGPYKFHGLPGLILSITDTKGYFNFELRKFKTVDEFFFPINKSNKLIIKTTKENFNKTKIDFEKNAFARIKARGIEIKNEERVRAKINNRFNNNNNPIELD